MPSVMGNGIIDQLFRVVDGHNLNKFNKIVRFYL